MKRKIGAILLLLLLTSPVWMVTLWTQLQIYSLRHEIKERIIAGLDPSELELLAFTKFQADKELDWEHEGEFEYRGEMFDVVRKMERADSVYFWCWKDEEETELNKDLERMLAMEKENQPLQKSQKEQLVKLLKSQFISQSGDLFEISFTQKTISHTPYTETYLNRFIAPAIPPPKR